MNSINSSDLKQITARPWWYSIRGALMMLLGGIVAFLCILAPDVHILGERFSWIPAIGTITLLVGLMRCIDAYLSGSLQGFLLNMQGGVLDIIVGTFVLFSISGQPRDLILLVAGYLLTQGVLRNILLWTVTIRNPISNRITGIISIVLGIMIWLDWPTSAPWFLAFSLSVDICFRGWALIMLASSIKNKPATDD